METETPGRTFEDVEDWLVYLRDVIARPGSHPELGASPTTWPATLEAAVRDGPRAERLSDAALALLEDGTEVERDAALELTLHAAPDAVPRLRALLERPGLSLDVRLRCASELLAASREDPVGLAVLREALAGPGVRRRALVAAARHLPEWPAGFIPLIEPDAALLLELWKETPVSRRRLFVDTVAANGSEHLYALIAGARELVRTSREQAAPLMKMLAPHLPDPTSGEIVVEAMVGSLRANRKDPRQAELAERILRKHDIWPRKPDSDDER